MDYYKILNFKKEPFSNSPDPDFFFQSSQHFGCLQRLEIAVRLRRGLSVVVGDVGTGKTTLCRQIIVRFSTSEEDKNNILPFLILDPSFSTPLEFLSNVAAMFGLSFSSENLSEWQLKEMIKNYLYEKGVDESRIVVLIIDEGQKLPHFCLEILREFLNYETNEYKLLQIVIFAQKEFELVLKNNANLSDRVNEHYFLEPLNFRETREMVKFRIKKASGENREVSLFTFSALWAIYKATGGYPRKIVILCHQAILTLIIQNKHKAGWVLIRSNVRRGTGAKPSKKIRWAIATVVCLLFAVSIVAGSPSIRINLWRKDTAKKPAVNNLPLPVAPLITKVENPAPDEIVTEKTLSEKPVPDKPISDKTAPMEKKAELLGQLTVTKKEPVWLIINRFYGGLNVNLQRLEAVIRANPQIKDFDNVEIGEKVNFPARPLKGSPLPEGRYWVKVTVRKNLGDAYRVIESYPNNYPPVRLFPYRSNREGTVFAVLMKDSFSDENSAMNSISLLPPALNSNAKVISRLEEGTVFF
ncbi:MAG: AAA family ATPase [Nitrospira sp.]|nr:AAA family ATPase [Nitrospira sp.]